MDYLDQEDIDNLHTLGQSHFFLKFSIKKKAYVFYLKAIKLIPDSIIIEIEDALLAVSQVDLPKLKDHGKRTEESKDNTGSLDLSDAKSNHKRDGISTDSIELDNSIIGFAHTFTLPLFIKTNELELYYRGNILLIILPRE